MFKNYAATALRNARKNFTSTFVNLIGLITGLMIFTLSWLFAIYEQNYDSFFENYQRIVSPTILIREDSPLGRAQFFAVHYGLKAAAKEQIGEVLYASHAIVDEMPISVNGERFRRPLVFVESDFFKIFSLQFIRGNADPFETNLGSVALSETGALNLFGSLDIIGNRFELRDGTPVEIVGVFKDLPANSHFTNDMGEDYPEFNYLVHRRAYQTIYMEDSGETDTNWMDHNWGSVSSSVHTYFLLDESADPSLLTENLSQITLNNTGEFWHEHMKGNGLRHLAEMNLNYWEREEVPGLAIAQGVGILILCIAIMNAISLNTANLIGRAREIGLRRVVGASRKDLTIQFMGESIFTSVVAVTIALMLLSFILPSLSSMFDRSYNLWDMLNREALISVFSVALLSGLLSISYPIYLMMGLKHAPSLSRIMNLGHSAAWIRKVLTTIQFALVTALVLAVVVVSLQNNHILQRSHEFQSDRMVSISGFYETEYQRQILALRNEIASLPNIERITLSSLSPYSQNVNITSFQKSLEDEQDIDMQIVAIDDQYLPVLDIPIIAGRNIDSSRSDDVLSREEDNARRAARNNDGEEDTQPPTAGLNVIVNLSAVKALGLGSPSNAVGQIFYEDRMPVTIVGVIDDIIIGGPNSELRPLVLSQRDNRLNAITVKFVDPEDIDIEAISAAVNRMMPTAPARVRPISETRDASMQSLHRLQTAFLLVAAISIILAATGLYALAAFLATSRKREMGIRKVHGASTLQLVRSLMAQFSKPVIVALGIGLPAGGYGMMHYLDYFPDRITLDATMFSSAALLTLLIAWFTIISHAIKSARTHPAEILRYE